MKGIITARDLAMVTSDIQGAQRRGAVQLVSSLIEIGGLLMEAKELVELKEWEGYIRDNFGYSTSTADNWMKLYREYGDDQASFFAKLQDSEAFGKLSYTKLLALTDIPAEERVEFVEKTHAEELSTRQLQQAIRERDENKRKLQDAEEKLQDAYTAIKEVKGEGEKQKQILEEAARAATKEKEKAQNKVRQLEKQLKEAEAAAKDTTKQEEAGTVSEDVMAKLRQEIAAEEAEKAAREAEKELKAAKEQAAQAEKKARQLDEQLRKQQKDVTMADPEVVEFKAMLQQVKEDFNRLNGKLKKIGLKDESTGRQLKAVALQLLEKLKEEVLQG